MKKKELYNALYKAIGSVYDKESARPSYALQKLIAQRCHFVCKEYAKNEVEMPMEKAAKKRAEELFNIFLRQPITDSTAEYEKQRAKDLAIKAAYDEYWALTNEIQSL